jgi:Domain of unknown function (DUF6378)
VSTDTPTQMPNAHATFVEAEATINGPRRGSYGDVHTSFGKIADMWSVILNRDTTSEEVALCMIALKLVREANAHKHDNVVDVMGYAGLLAELTGGAK